MKKQSLMGSSKYENNPEQLDKDYADRKAFLEEIDKEINDDGDSTPLDKYVNYYSSCKYFYSYVFRYYESEGHKFTLTFESFKERGLLICAKELEEAK